MSCRDVFNASCKAVSVVLLWEENQKSSPLHDSAALLKMRVSFTLLQTPQNACVIVEISSEQRNVAGVCEDLSEEMWGSCVCEGVWTSLCA